MNILEMQESVLNLKEELRQILENGEKEVRSLNDEENSRIAEIKNQIDALNEQIENEQRANDNNNKENKENRKMSKIKLTNLINAFAENRALNDDEKAYLAEARSTFAESGIAPKGQIQMRSTIVAGTDANGGYDVATELQPLEVAVRNNLVSSVLGIDILGGLQGDVSIPKYSGSEVKWKGEVATADNGEGTFSEVLLTPKRLTAVVDISKQMLIQASDDIEGILINDLARAIAEKIDLTMFGDASGDTNTPAGIFSTTATTSGETALSAVTYDNLLNLELEVEENNGRNYKFVMSPNVKFAYKGTQMASGLQMVVDGNEIDGYPFISSNSVVKGGIACLDPKMIVMGAWGYDLTVDPYTKAADGQVRLVVNAYYDWKLRGDMIATEVYG